MVKQQYPNHSNKYNFDDFQTSSEYFSKVFDQKTPTPFDKNENEQANFKKFKQNQNEIYVEDFDFYVKKAENKINSKPANI